MPTLNGPGCLTDLLCDVAVTFPKSPAVCRCDYRTGGVNDLYFIPCNETMSNTNITDPTWWQGLVDDEKLGQLGKGLGSLSKAGEKKEVVSSCGGEIPISATWQLQHIIKCFDKTSADTTRLQVNTLIKSYNRFLLIARLCDGEESIIPVGAFTTSGYDYVIPESADDLQSVTLQFQWKEFGLPQILSIPGLASIVPKAK